MILVVSLAVYDALLFSSFEREIWAQREASARVAADSLNLNVSSSVRLGKNLDTYRGLDRAVARAADNAGIPLAVLSPAGRVIESTEDFPPLAFSEGEVITSRDDLVMRENGAGRTIFVPVAGTGKANAGWIGAWIDGTAVHEALTLEFLRQGAIQLASAVAGFLLLVAAFAFSRRMSEGTKSALDFSHRARVVCIGIFLAVMLGNGASALHTVSARYTETLRADAARTGAQLTDTIERLIAVGINL